MNQPFNRKFSWQQFHQPEVDIAILLKKFCEKKGIHFEIVGSSIDNFKNEKEYYEKFLGKKNWIFLRYTAKKRGLILTLKSKFVVTIDSTLGYECLSRGQRVGFFTIRDRYINYDHLKFKDHYNYSKSDLKNIRKSEMILTTEKDFVKLSTIFRDRPIYYLPIQIKLHSKEKFDKLILNYCDN